MSLVNKVLRDLDARRAGEGERTSLPAAVTPLAARLDRSTRWPLIAVAVVIVAALLGLGASYLQGDFQRRKPELRSLPDMVVAPVPANVSAPSVVPAPAVNPVTTPTDLPAATSGTPGPQVLAGTAAPRAEPIINTASALRLSDELGRVPEPRKSVRATVPPRREMNPSTLKPAQAPPISEPTPAAQQAASAANPVSTARDARVQEPVAETRVEKQERKPLPAETADAYFRRGLAAQRQGNAGQAAGLLRQALEVHPEHTAARQALVAMLLEAKQFDEADELLRRGVEIPGARMASVLSLARLKVEKGDAPAALDLLMRNAGSGERSAEYQGFLGALLNRVGRTGEAIERYQFATRLAPAEARWWAGLGISLDAASRSAEARDAYLKARGLPGLPADLAQHVEQRLR